MSTIHGADTIDFHSSQHDTGGRRPPAVLLPVRADVAGKSHPGKVRANNEDHFLITRFGRYLEALQSNLPAGSVPANSQESGYGMLVADGVGGSVAGEVASRLAISTLVDLVLTTPDWI